MNKQSLGALIALNIVLLLALVLSSISPQPAYAQLRGADYMMLPGTVNGRNGQSAIYVLDLQTSRVIGLFFNTGNNQFELIDGRDITQDVQAQPRSR